MKKENRKNRFGSIQYLLLISILVSSVMSFAQQITLEEAMEKAQMLSPTKKQEAYYQSLFNLNDLNEEKGNLPTINISGQYTYQSDVFQLPFSVPGSDVPSVPKDQYRISLDISQKIYDGGLVKNRRLLTQTELTLNNSTVDVSLYQVRELVKEIYFGALILQENEKILQASLSEFDNQISRAKASVKNGILLKTDLETVEIEKMNIEAQLIQVRSKKKAMYRVLSNWLGEKLSLQTALIVPAFNSAIGALDFQRSELKVFDAQTIMLNAQKSMVESVGRPKLFAFANTGIGSPNPYNFFETDASTFYMAGLKLQWNAFDWGVNKRKKEALTVNQQIVASKKENFTKHINDDMIKKEHELQELEELLRLDDQILSRQSTITRTRETQFQKGTVSASDYLSDINKEIRAKQNKSLHTIMRLKTKFDLLAITGNL